VQKILFLASDPANEARLRLMEEHRRIQERIKLSKNRDEIVLATTLAARTSDFTQALLDERPSILHFSGHGSQAGAICLQNDVGTTKLVEAPALGALLALFKDDIRCVVLNACYSAVQAEAIGAHIDYVVGMPNTITDDAAIAYSIGFYSALGAGRSIEDAHKFGVAQIGLDGLASTGDPVLTARTALGSPAFLETPTAPAAAPNYDDFVLLMTDEAGLMLVRATDVAIGTLLTLDLAPEGDPESAYISRLKPGAILSLAYGSTALLLQVKERAQSWSGGHQRWRITGTPNSGPYVPPFGEMSALGYSADALATMRARRILLDERLPIPDRNEMSDVANQSFLEMFVRGFDVPLQVTQSPLPGLYAELKNNSMLFSAAARLMAILWLRLSGVIETVEKLSFEIKDAGLSVDFRGQRFQRYNNVKAAVIEIQGVCELAREGATLSVPSKIHEVMFDGERRFDIVRGTVVFSGEADGKRILCFLSEEALLDYFGADPSKDGLLAAFDSNVAEIQRIAIALLKNGRLDEERRLFIRTADVSTLRGGG